MTPYIYPKSNIAKRLYANGLVEPIMVFNRPKPVNGTIDLSKPFDKDTEQDVTFRIVGVENLELTENYRGKIFLARKAKKNATLYESIMQTRFFAQEDLIEYLIEIGQDELVKIILFNLDELEEDRYIDAF